MAYVLGFIFADGAIIDSRKSSRTCYLTITICDKNLLVNIRGVINSNHPIQIIPPSKITIREKTYISSERYKLRIGSKLLFQDLINLGVFLRKSLRETVPEIPHIYFGFFLRGYFDGDGCIYVGFRKDSKKPMLKIILTNGGKKFLENIASTFNTILNITQTKVYKNGYAYRLSYRKKSSLKILSYMYSGLDKAPCLERKYNIYQNYIKNANIST